MNRGKLLALIMGVNLFLGNMGFGSVAAAAENQIKMAGVININTASPIELMQLPGIGVARAEEIVAYRERREFKRTSDLMRIKGIGRKMYDRIAGNLTVTEPTKLTIIRKTK